MKIDIIGAGPAGLFFAYLMKRDFPKYTIRIFEQNQEDATFGFGVVFSGRALHYIAQGDKSLVDRISSKMQHWGNQHIVKSGETVVIDGSSYAAIERLTLLCELRDACIEQGVQINYGERIEALRPTECDIMVGADGANSIVRDHFSDAFGTKVTDLGNFFAWYGVDYPYQAHTLTFERNDSGVFCGHHYRYTPSRSTFVAEVDNETWYKSGMYGMNDGQRQMLFEDIFKNTLGGNKLLNNRSIWRRYRLIENDRWHFSNIVLIGDALRTAHPSIGSGTRLAMEDAISLWQVLSRNSEDVEQVFSAYQMERAPIRNNLNSAAGLSIKWYENVVSKMDIEPYAFAYDYVMRTGIMSHERFVEESPLFCEELAKRSGEHPPPP